MQRRGERGSEGQTGRVEEGEGGAKRGGPEGDGVGRGKVDMKEEWRGGQGRGGEDRSGAARASPW